MRSLQHLPSQAWCSLPCSFSPTAGCRFVQLSPQLTSTGTVTTCLGRDLCNCIVFSSPEMFPDFIMGSWPWQDCHVVTILKSSSLFSGIKSFHPFYFKSRQMAWDFTSRECSAKKMQHHCWWDSQSPSQSVLLRLLFSLGTCGSSLSHQTELPSTFFREVPSQASSLAYICFIMDPESPVHHK